MYDMLTQTGGPKYRAHLHDFKASVFGFAAAGVVSMAILHAAVLSTPAGHQKWLDIVATGTSVTTSAVTK